LAVNASFSPPCLILFQYKENLSGKKYFLCAKPQDRGTSGNNLSLCNNQDLLQYPAEIKTRKKKNTMSHYANKAKEVYGFIETLSNKSPEVAKGFMSLHHGALSAEKLAAKGKRADRDRNLHCFSL